MCDHRDSQGTPRRGSTYAEAPPSATGVTRHRPWDGAALGGILSRSAIAVPRISSAVCPEEFADTHTFQTFELRAMMERHATIQMDDSIVHHVYRALGVKHLHRDDPA